MDKEARIERARNPLKAQDIRAHEVAKTTEDVAARNIIHELLDEMDNMIVRIEELEANLKANRDEITSLESKLRGENDDND